MFDLVGIFDFDTPDVPQLSSRTLPAMHWGGVIIPVRQVTGRGLVGLYAEDEPGSPSYHEAHGQHLFLVGEARLRWDARLPAEVGHLSPASSGPLSAPALLDLFQVDPGRFIHWLKGNFTLVLIDETCREVALYNSRFGISPFYYALEGERFLFSTSLSSLARERSSQPGLDKVAVMELALFNYPLGNRTFLQGIKMLCPAEILRVTDAGLSRQIYWDVRTLYDLALFPTREALEIGATLFHQTVNDLATDSPRVRLSLTSGFDSRAILAVLEKSPADYLGYSFGLPESLNVTIPQRMARDLGIPYQPVVLNGSYEAVFDDYAWRAIMLSDCLATGERANYPYAFERLMDFSPVVITGLFGSELLRTFQNVGHIVSAGLARLNTAPDILAELQDLLDDPESMRYWRPEWLADQVDEVRADVAITLIEPWDQMSRDRRFYMFLLTQGLRQYFGPELHTERPYGINRTPFLDDEFVEFLFRAPFAGVYSRTLRPTLGNRYRSQFFYAYIIRKYRPDLLSAPTDHGYGPGAVLLPMAMFVVGPKHLFSKWRRQRKGYSEFKTEEWTEGWYQRHLFSGPDDSGLFSPRLGEDFRSGAWKANRLEFAKAASLKMWLRRMGAL